MNGVTDVPLELCYPSDDARAVDAKAVKALAGSISEVGLLNPISVRRAIKVRAGQDAEAFEVLAGMHRVKAFRQLGRETIPAFVFEADDLHAALVLIDENLCRKDLSPAERAAQVAKRKRIYEALYPETAHGAAGKHRPKSQSRQFGDSETVNENNRFTVETAERSGHSERSVQREAARGEALGEDTLAKVARTSLDKGDELDALAKLSTETRNDLVSRAVDGEKVSAKVALKKEQRSCREDLLGHKQRALPDRRYGVILADPEWRFEPYSRDTGMDRAADNHYPTSATEAIASRPVANIAAVDCVLFLWATAPMLPHALLVMEKWGFDYKTHIVWRKAEKYAARPVLGTGYWFRNGHELLLVGTRGKVPAPAPGTQWASLADAAPRKHSEKPDWQYELIEAYFPNLPKIELNARRRRDGWDAWGFEAPDADVQTSLPPHDPETGELIEGTPAGLPTEDGERPAGERGLSTGNRAGITNAAGGTQVPHESTAEADGSDPTCLGGQRAFEPRTGSNAREPRDAPNGKLAQTPADRRDDPKIRPTGGDERTVSSDSPEGNNGSAATKVRPPDDNDDLDIPNFLKATNPDSMYARSQREPTR